MAWEIWAHLCLAYAYDCLDNILPRLSMLREGRCFDRDLVVMGDGRQVG